MSKTGNTTGDLQKALESNKGKTILKDIIRKLLPDLLSELELSPVQQSGAGAVNDNSEQLSELKNQISEHRKQIEELKKENEGLVIEKSSFEQKNKILSDENENLKKQLQAYQTAIDLWNTFSALSPEAQGALGSLYTGNELGFIISLATRKSLDSLYEWLAYHQADGDPNFNSVKKLYDSALELFCRTYADYIVYKPDMGQEYDDRFMARSSDSAVFGKAVSAVIIAGYGTTVGTVHKKSIVRT